MSRATMLVLTLIYLIAEASFNARLLDVVGAPKTVDAVRGIEQWGRLISGIAAALLLWGAITAKMTSQGKSFGSIVATNIVLGIPLVFTVYNAERMFVESGANDSAPEHRQLAAYSVLLTDHLYEIQSLDGLPLTAEQLETPQGKSFFALFPNLYFAVLSNVTADESLLKNAVSFSVKKNLGGPNSTYNSIYIPAIEETKTLYNKYYVPGVLSYKAALDSADQKAEEAWESYVSELRRYRTSPSRLPARFHDRARRTARNKGAPVPSNWNPADRATFEYVVIQKIYNEAENAYKRRVESFFPGSALPPTLTTFEEFLAHRTVQNHLRRTLNMPDNAPKVTAKWDVPTWNHNWYAPTVSDLIETTFRTITEDKETYGLGGKNYCRGVNAYHALNVPGFALQVSIIGLSYHASKVFYYFLSFFVPLLKRNYWSHLIVTAIFFAAIAVVPFSQTNAIVESESYKKLVAHKEYQLGAFDAKRLDWVIRAQQLLYPISHSLHISAMNGYEFHPLMRYKGCHA